MDRKTDAFGVGDQRCEEEGTADAMDTRLRRTHSDLGTMATWKQQIRRQRRVGPRTRRNVETHLPARSEKAADVPRRGARTRHRC